MEKRHTCAKVKRPAVASSTVFKSIIIVRTTLVVTGFKPSL
jgi:hypothetical protein